MMRNDGGRLLCCLVLLASHQMAWAAEKTAPATAPAAIPKTGLVLWLSAGEVVTEQGDITAIRDQSGNKNDALREQAPKVVAGNPAVVTHEDANQPVLRFGGGFCGYALKPIPDARTVFFVVSKHPATFKKFAERHVIEGFPTGWHWCDTIIECGLLKHVKAWFNGFGCDPAVSEFPRKLAVITFATGRDHPIKRIFRDRDFPDRSWYGDVGELLIYNADLSQDDRQAVEKYLMNKYAITPFEPVTVPRDSVLPGHVKKPPEEPVKK